MSRRIWILAVITAAALCLSSCRAASPAEKETVATAAQTAAVTADKETAAATTADKETTAATTADEETAAAVTDAASESTSAAAQEPQTLPAVETLTFDTAWQYASESLTHSDSVKLYHAPKSRKGKVVCVNAGHGCRAGVSKYTYCHPDKTPKVTGGSTAAGSIKAISISGGTVLNDGTPEGTATLELAITVRDRLLADGYDVLMLREEKDVQLDNIARTVFANQYADCHISFHYDSTQSDKGLFFTGVPDIASYRNMEPVKSHYREHTRLGEAIIEGERAAGVRIYGSGRVNIDLTQTSYSTVASVDLEVGDRASDHSAAQREKIARGISAAMDIFFGK